MVYSLGFPGPLNMLPVPGTHAILSCDPQGYPIHKAGMASTKRIQEMIQEAHSGEIHTCSGNSPRRLFQTSYE